MEHDRRDGRNGVEAAAWTEGYRRHQAIRQLLGRHRGRLTTGDVSDVARELGVSRATLYRLIGIYRTVGSVEALLPRRPGRRTGARVLSDAVETIVCGAIAEAWPGTTLGQLVERIHARCREAGLPPPHRRTIRARLVRSPQSGLFGASGPAGRSARPRAAISPT